MSIVPGSLVSVYWSPRPRKKTVLSDIHSTVTLKNAEDPTVNRSYNSFEKLRSSRLIHTTMYTVLAWKPGIKGFEVPLGKLVAVSDADGPRDLREVDGPEERTSPGPS